MKKLREDTTWSKEEKTLLARCRLAIESVDPSAKVILYGSRARGEAEPESDYDLLIITDGEVNLRREDVFRKKMYPIEMETGAVLTVILVSSKDWNSALYAAMPFYQNIQRDGVVL
jgi:predicted nucleotidyltransferase